MLRDSAVESANVTNARPAAGMSSAVRSWRPTDGKAGAGNPEGIGPTTATPSPVNPNTAVAAAAPTTASTIPGTLGHQRRHPRITPRDATPTTSEGTTVAPSRTPRTKPSNWSYTPVADAVKPNSFGSWLTTTTTAIPLRKPMRTGLEKSSARMPIRASPAATHKAPIRQREQAGERDGPRRIALGADERQQRGSDHGAERGVGAEHEELRRPEERVGEQGDHRGVEAGDGREAGERRVRHALRHEQDGQHQPGDDVLARPTPFVGPRHDDARDAVEDLPRPSECSVGHRSSVHLGAVLDYGRWSFAASITVAGVLGAGPSPAGRVQQDPPLGAGHDPSGPVDRVGIDRDRGDAEAHQLLGELRAVRGCLPAE